MQQMEGSSSEIPPVIALCLGCYRVSIKNNRQGHVSVQAHELDKLRLISVSSGLGELKIVWPDEGL